MTKIRTDMQRLYSLVQNADVEEIIDVLKASAQTYYDFAKRFRVIEVSCHDNEASFSEHATLLGARSVAAFTIAIEMIAAGRETFGHEVFDDAVRRCVDSDFCHPEPLSNVRYGFVVVGEGVTPGHVWVRPVDERHSDVAFEVSKMSGMFRPTAGGLFYATLESFRHHVADATWERVFKQW